MESFDALYPFHGDNWELSQSVRLLRKFSNVRNIYVVGDDPRLPDITHIPFIQQDRKEINIWKKVLAGCFIEDMSEKFLFMNDDHFLTRGTDFPLVHGERPSECSEQYFNAMVNTSKKLVELGKNDTYFDIHYPFFVEKNKFLGVFSVFNDGTEYVFKSAYCNFWGMEGDFAEDKKIKFLGGIADYRAFIGDSWCFSTELLTEPLKELILQM